MDGATFEELHRQLSAIETEDDVERIRARLRTLEAEAPGDPDVPAIGEMLAMIARIPRDERPGARRRRTDSR